MLKKKKKNTRRRILRSKIYMCSLPLFPGPGHHQLLTASGSLLINFSTCSSIAYSPYNRHVILSQCKFNFIEHTTQGFCTCWTLFLKCFCPRYPYNLPPHLFLSHCSNVAFSMRPFLTIWLKVLLLTLPHILFLCLSFL